MAVRMCRTLCRARYLCPTRILPLYGLRGFRLAGRTAVYSSMAPLWQSKPSWIRHTISDTTLTVAVRQLFTQVRSRLNHNPPDGPSSTRMSGLVEAVPGTSSKTSVRQINTCSKLGKRKTCKAVAKRFLRTGKGKLKRWRAGKSHNMMSKGSKRSRQLRKPTYCSKQQLKLLNKMLNGW